MAYKMKGFPMIKGTSPAKETVKRGRKKHARGSREYAHHIKGEEPGTTSTHVMAWDEGKGGKFYAFPTITTDKEGYKVREKETAMSEAERAGELYEFKNKRRAERFAAGSWKPRKAKKIDEKTGEEITYRPRREAMRKYRKRKREERRDSKKIHPDNVTEAQKRQARDEKEYMD